MGFLEKKLQSNDLKNYDNSRKNGYFDAIFHEAMYRDAHVQDFFRDFQGFHQLSMFIH